MKTNKTYRALLDKSISSMIAAIEIYNKPDFDYREETFAILAVNSWEMLLKAVMFKINKYNLRLIYELKPKIKKDGTKSKIKDVSLSRCGNKKLWETTRYIEYVKDLMTTKENDDYEIAISINVNFNKASTLEAIPVRFSKEGMPIYLSDDAMRIRFPLTYKEIAIKCKERYSNFKQNKDFNDHMKVVKHNPHLAHERKLDEKNPKSAKTTFYSTNIWQELDKYYKKR